MAYLVYSSIGVLYVLIAALLVAFVEPVTLPRACTGAPCLSCLFSVCSLHSI